MRGAKSWTRVRSRRRRRRGSALVESIFTIGAMVTITLGLVDFGLMVLKHHSLSQAARQLCRQAIVRGDLAIQGSWGPGSVNVLASDTGQIGTFVRNNTLLLDPDDITIQVDWPDGNNSVQIHDRVSVTLTAQDVRPWLTFMFGSQGYTMTAASSMPIAH